MKKVLKNFRNLAHDLRKTKEYSASLILILVFMGQFMQSKILHVKHADVWRK